MIDVFSRFASIGDNCEFGLVQRWAGCEEGSVLRWARSFSISSVINLFEADFQDLFAEDALLPCCFGMVEDQKFKIQFHSELRTMREGSSWVCLEDDSKRKSIMRKERDKMQFLVGRLRGHLSEASKILVYKTSEVLSADSIAALLRSLRRYGDNKLLLVTSDPRLQPPRLEQVHGNPFRGRINHFGAYQNVVNDMRPADWLTLCSMLLSRIDSHEHPLQTSPLEPAEQEAKAVGVFVLPSDQTRQPERNGSAARHLNHIRLFEGLRYVSLLHRAGTETLVVVVFEPSRGPTATDDTRFWGDEFFAREEINAIGIVDRRGGDNDDKELGAVCAAIVDATPGMERVGLGIGVGGDALLRFARSLGLQRALAMVPTWSAGSRCADNERTQVEARTGAGALWVAYDPTNQRSREGFASVAREVEASAAVSSLRHRSDTGPC